MKIKTTVHTYTEWRDQLSHEHRAIVDRLMYRDGQSPAPVHTTNEALIVVLVKLLDAGGETTDYIDEPIGAWA